MAISVYPAVPAQRSYNSCLSAVPVFCIFLPETAGQESRDFLSDGSVGDRLHFLPGLLYIFQPGQYCVVRAGAVHYICHIFFICLSAEYFFKLPGKGISDFLCVSAAVQRNSLSIRHIWKRIACRTCCFPLCCNCCKDSCISLSGS